MSRESLPRRAFEIYFDEGLKSLLESVKSYIRYKIRSSVYPQFASAVEYLRQQAPGEFKTIELNGVDVPIEIKSIDKYIPFYQPAYPTTDDPFYEYTEAEAIRTYAKEGDDVVVIGGGLGVTSVIASRVTGGNVTVFEQSPSTYRILKRTINANECSDDVTLRCAAIGEASESNLTHQNLSKINKISPMQLPEADVYEIDCEGAETTILRTMEAKPPTLLIETHNNNREVISILEKKDYEIINIVTGGKGQHPDCSHIRAQLSP